MSGIRRRTGMPCLSFKRHSSGAPQRSYGLQSGELFDSKAGTGVLVIINDAQRC